MSLATQLARFVSHNVQHRGREYLAGGRVESLDTDGHTVHAIVRGTNEYQVSLAREHDEILAACSCPYFGDRLVGCKHIWATILTADLQGAFAANGERNAGELRLVAIPPEDAGLETEVFDELDSPREWRPWQPPPRRPRQPPRVDRWTQFTSALERARADPNGRGGPSFRSKCSTSPTPRPRANRTTSCSRSPDAIASGTAGGPSRGR